MGGWEDGMGEGSEERWGMKPRGEVRMRQEAMLQSEGDIKGLSRENLWEIA